MLRKRQQKMTLTVLKVAIFLVLRTITRAKGSDSEEGASNIAGNKTAYQTDTQTDRVAALAVDGDPGTCSVTSSNDSSWEVDLGEKCHISHVIICCANTLKDLDLYTGDKNDDYKRRNFKSETVGSWKSIELTGAAGRDGRWVKITRTAGQTDPLMLCEVEVFEDLIDLTNYTDVTKTTAVPAEEKTEMRFEVDALKRGTGEIIDTKLSSSKQQCCFHCLVNTGCKNANYHHGDGTCTLLSSTEYVADVDDNTVMLTPDRD